MNVLTNFSILFGFRCDYSLLRHCFLPVDLHPLSPNWLTIALLRQATWRIMAATHTLETPTTRTRTRTTMVMEAPAFNAHSLRDGTQF